jgi:lactoylglutathione lyase
MLKFYHCNHSVLDLERSVRFYEEQFGLVRYRDVTAYGGALKLAFMKDGSTEFRLELTWNRDHREPYALGDKEFHVAFYSDDFDNDLRRHRAAGIVVEENMEIGFYYVEDPDGYRVEVVRA